MRGLAGEVVLGRYRIEHPIGQGGFGRVFAARQVSLNRQVALKASNEAGRGDAVARERFRREAVLVARINHPNVVTYHDFGVDEDDDQVLVMEYLAGATLQQVLRRHGPMSVDRVAWIVAQAAAGLGEAHARGLVHRDVKPSNLFLVAPGTTGERVKVIDFGILRARGGADADLRQLTRTDAFLGTPAYAAPEMLLGREPDGRTDQYALALVAVELATGRRAFGTEHGIESPFDRVEALPPDIVRLPPGIRGVLTRALAIDPRDRFPTMLSFAQEILAGAERDAGPTEETNATGSDDTTVALTVRTGPTRVTARPRKIGVAIAIGGLMAAAAVGGWILGRPEAAPDHAPASMAAALPGQAAGAVPALPAPAMAPPPVPSPAPVESPAPPASPASVPPPSAALRGPVPSPAGPGSRAAASDGASSRVDVSPARPRQPGGTAVLVLNAYPWASVFVDGKEIGRTPQLSVKVAPGTHAVEFRNPTLGTRRFTPSPREGETVRLTAYFQEPPGASRSR